MLPKEYGSGSTCHRRFQDWTASKVFQKLWVRLLKVYDDLRGIRWTWQSLDSISVKAHLGGFDLSYLFLHRYFYSLLQMGGYELNDIILK
jgi:transposase